MTGTPLDEAFKIMDEATGEVMAVLGSVPEDIVARAEAFLGIRLPASYRSFVLRYGHGFAGPYEIYGLRPNELVPETTTLNFVGRTLNARGHGLPADMVVVYDIGNGEDYVLDLSRGEPPRCWPGARPPVGIARA